jgi:hemolysin D
VHGQVLSVSQDSIIRDRQQDRSNDRALGTQNDTSEPKGEELNYSARISLDGIVTLLGLPAGICGRKP